MSNNTAVIDLTNYKDRVGGRIPEDTYRVVVEDVETDESKAGNKMINVWFRVLDGDYKDAEIIDRLLPENKNALFRVVAFMQALGMPTPKKRLQVNLSQWVGKRLDIEVADGEPYNGRVRSEVRGYMRIVGQQQAAEETSDLADIGEPEPAPVPQAAQEPASEPQEAPAASPAPAAAPAQETVEEAPQEVDLATLNL